jgi:DnaK suppressor protein
MDLHTFKNTLSAERDRLLSHSRKSIETELNISSDDLPDEADLAASEIQQSLLLKQRNQERMRIAKIDTALRKIEDGSFGLCENCDEAIHPGRLLANPASTHCVICQEKNERMKKFYA